MQQVVNLKERIILGIDPGTAVMGYGLVKETGPKIELIAMGVVKMPTT
jgi:crossover junction endodeoxyribonuclease RuvC